MVHGCVCVCVCVCVCECVIYMIVCLICVNYHFCSIIKDMMLHTMYVPCTCKNFILVNISYLYMYTIQLNLEIFTVKIFLQLIAATKINLMKTLIVLMCTGSFLQNVFNTNIVIQNFQNTKISRSMVLYILQLCRYFRWTIHCSVIAGCDRRVWNSSHLLPLLLPCTQHVTVQR